MITLYSKCTIESILLQSPDGKKETFLINTPPRTRLEQLTLLADYLGDICPSGQPFLETKVTLGSRYKRIELILLVMDYCYFFKVTDSARFDKDLLSLNYMIDSIKALQGSKFTACIVLVVLGDYDKNLIQNYCAKYTDMSTKIISFKDITNGVVNNGVFN